MAVSASQIISGLMARGVPRIAAIGLAGNYQIESGLDTGINEINPVVPGSRGGFGLAQWTGPRRKQYEAFAGSKGKPLDDLDTQLDFTVWELANTEKKAAESIFAAKTVEEAAERVSDKFLRPGIPHKAKRIAAASAISGGGGSDDLFGYDTLTGASGGDTLGDDRQRRALELLGIAPASDTQAAPPADDRQNRIRELLGIQGEQPSVADAYSAPLDDVAGTGALAPRAYDPTQEIVQPEKPFFDITQGAIKEPLEMLGATGRSVMGTGPSVSAGMLPEGIPEGARQGVGRVLDVGLGPLAALGLGASAAAGAVGDVAESIGVPNPAGLTRDILAMPDAFAGTLGGGLARGTPDVGRPSAPVAPAAQVAPRVEPRLTASRPATELATDTGVKQDELRSLVVKASRNNKAARAEIAAMAKVDLEAAAAAERLGIDVEADVFADNEAVRQVVGMVRATKGSDAAIEWRERFAGAQQRASEILSDEGGTVDLSVQSEGVRTALKSSIDDLRNQATPIYTKVEESIPVGSRMQPTETVKEFNRIVTELGGIEALSPSEQKIFKLLGSNEGITYARLNRERAQMARAAFENAGPYADADRRTATALYNAMKEDRRNFVAAMAGDDTAKQLDNADSLWSSAKDLEDSLVKGFGREANGSIASKISSALTTGSKGDIKGLQNVLSIVPDDLRKEAILTGIAHLSGGLGGQGGFSFPRYSKLYRGLRNNSEVYSKISKELGPQTSTILRDLYEVSVRIDRAESNIDKTGRANQAMIAEGLVAKMLNGPSGQVARTGVGGAVGAAVSGGNPIVAGMMAAGAGSTKVGRNRVNVASDLFRSEAFKKAAVEAATQPQVSEKTVKRLQNSPAYKRWAKSFRIEDPDAWILGALTAQEGSENGN